mgnify:CR=1 FL=1
MDVFAGGCAIDQLFTGKGLHAFEISTAFLRDAFVFFKAFGIDGFDKLAQFGRRACDNAQKAILTLADEEAAALGEDVSRLRFTLIVSATLVTGASVAIAGIVGWVGLVVPHAARLLVGPRFARSLPAALLLGAAFVAIADTLARSAAAIELPLGILTAFVGAPAFLWLLARGGRFS